jgi:hypothetical protein
MVHADPDAQRRRLELLQHRNDRVRVQSKRIQEPPLIALERLEPLARQVQRATFGRVFLLHAERVVVVVRRDVRVERDGLERVDGVLLCRGLCQEDACLIHRDPERVPKEDTVYVIVRRQCKTRREG